MFWISEQGCILLIYVIVHVLLNENLGIDHEIRAGLNIVFPKIGLKNHVKIWAVLRFFLSSVKFIIISFDQIQGFTHMQCALPLCPSQSPDTIFIICCWFCFCSVWGFVWPHPVIWRPHPVLELFLALCSVALLWEPDAVLMIEPRPLMHNKASSSTLMLSICSWYCRFFFKLTTQKLVFHHSGKEKMLFRKYNSVITQHDFLSWFCSFV